MKRFAGAALATATAGLVLWWMTGQHSSRQQGVQPAPIVSTQPAQPQAIAPALLSAQAASLPSPATEPQTRLVANTNAFAAFADWLEVYDHARLEEKSDLLVRGKELAQKRANALANLIQQDPASAIEQALTYGQRKALPPELAAFVERPLNTTAPFEAIGSTPLDPANSTVAAVRRAVRVNGDLYETFTYGAALQWPSLPNQALNGIVLPASATPNVLLAPYPTGIRAGLAAVSPNPVRVLAANETVDYLKSLQAEPICGVSGLAVNTTGSAVVTQTGGQYNSFCNQNHAQTANSEGVDAAGVDGSSTTTDLPTWPTGTGTATATWTKGTGKRYIFCRPIFPDYKGYTSDSAVFAAYTGYSNYVVHTSYGQIVPAAIGTNKAVGSFVTPPLLLPHTVAEYENNTADITQDIINALHTAGVTLKPYQFFCIVNASKPGFNAAGLGSIGPSMGTDGGSQSWCRLMGDTTSLDPSLLGHELGHNLYLSHSHGWNTAGRSVIGPGSNDEYGDPDSLMGATWGRDSYTANLRFYLNWLSGTAVQTVTSAGLRHISLATLDDNTTGIRAARIKHPKYSQYYWLEYRSGRSWMDATEASQSLGLRWGSPNGSEAWWLNIGANRLGANRLALGHTFSDPVGDVHITPVSILSTSPATLDVVVAIGPFPSNNIPTATLAASRTAAGVGGSVKFTVTASDADGDTLAYGWDFGGDGADGPVAQNTNVVTHVFATAGYYNIRCQVSDMKGGVSTESVLVKIGSPTGFTVAGKVMAADGSPLEGIQVRADDTHYAFTDSDGAYSITEVPAGTYSLAASDPVSDDFIFESWLAAPLVISRNVSGANFTTLNRSDTSGMRVEYYSDNNFGSLQQVARNSAVRFPSTVVPGAKSVRWTGLFNAPVAGPYLLHATGSGSVRLIVNGDSSGGLTTLGANQEATAYVRLSEGQPCSLQVEFSAADTNAVLDLQWTTPAGGLSRFTPEKLYPSIGGLRGSYYANKSLTNLVFSRLDPIVHFPTGVTPGPRLPGDSYSVRWTGKVLTRNAGLYKFTTTSDDGVRLWVDGKRMVNAWTDHAPRDDSGSLSLAADKAYDVVLEYYQGTGGAEISLQWTPPGGVREVIPAKQLMPSYSGLWAEYYNVETLDGSPGVTQLDPQVDFDYASDAPTPGIDSTTYSGRWLGWLNAPTNGTYQFTVWADDATRLWVNGQKIIDNWGFQGAVELTGSINLSTNAPVPIRLEMQQIGGASGVRLGWKPPGSTNSVIPSDRLQPQRAGLWAQYFDNDQLAGVPVAGLYRSTVSDDYAANGLPPGITSNPFSVRWTGRVNASATISHRIYLVSTGGARLYWDGKLVIDDWTLHTKHEASFQTNLLTGVWHDLVVEYRNQTGNGLAQLSWARTGLTRQAIPSFNLQPPTATLSPIAAHLVGAPGQLKLQWAADLGPLPVLGTSDLGTSNGWPTETGTAYLSNGLWYLNLDEGTNTARFFQLNPMGN